MSTITPQRRRVEIESLMSGQAEVDIQSLAAHFGVSEMTIRRDLGTLEEEGIVRRLVGGRALLLDAKSREPALSTRAQAAHETKAHIGRAVAELLVDDEVVFIDGGSTALAVAHALRGSGRRLTVLTRSLLVASELAEETAIEIFMLGGRVKSSEMLTTSSAAADDLRHYNVDSYVMGISGVHPQRGLTDYDPDESAGKRLALERSDRVILAADHSKLGRVLMSRVAAVEEIDVLVTDSDHEALASMPSTLSVVIVEPSQ
ncbi:DeoR/GlpR family DNA-binding transcription regulator [Microbacterium pseudoresistens]|uniref:Lactose phosphotransferase system repressor n=1 Tax=Microbacterium pseudoresistens TaxID=640634 RepID=A0A7Y9JN57_9MICO|nr:DeoR/GlpR family DNA-binding transcription regulator [Microbacterium pseudoresistens]NYD53319.1 DeoR/GlpR family transcriptional regulator of sugar metabolism [Microbacterium pseudoresistens]